MHLKSPIFKIQFIQQQQPTNTIVLSLRKKREKRKTFYRDVVKIHFALFVILFFCTMKVEKYPIYIQFELSK